MLYTNTMEENKKMAKEEEKSKSKILCTINIVTYNALGKVQETVEALSWAKLRKDLKLYIVDNASTEPVSNYLQTVSWAEVFQLEKNVGFGSGHNFLYNKSRSEEAKYTLVLNPDCIITETDFEKLIATAQDKQEVAIVGPKILDFNGIPEKSIGKELKISNTLFAMFGQLLGIKQRMPNIPSAGVHKVEAITGACMLVKNSLIEKIGFFEPRFFMYYEDSEFCLRARKAGYEVVFNADAQAKHHLNSSSNTVENSNDWKNEMMFKSLLIYFDIHKNWLQKRILKYGWIAGLIVRYIIGRRKESSLKLIKHTLDFKFR